MSGMRVDFCEIQVQGLQNSSRSSTQNSKFFWLLFWLLYNETKSLRAQKRLQNSRAVKFSEKTCLREGEKKHACEGEKGRPRVYIYLLILFLLFYCFTHRNH